MKIPVLLGVCLLVVSSQNIHAEQSGAAMVAGYSKCLEKRHAEKAAAQAKCAQYKSEGPLDSCNSRIISNDMIIFNCKLETGVGSGSAACTVEEAEAMRKREAELGISDPSEKDNNVLFANFEKPIVDLNPPAAIMDASGKVPKPTPRPPNSEIRDQVDRTPGQKPPSMDKAKVDGNPGTLGAGSSAGQDPAAAQAQANADLNSCANLQAQANQCCGNPMSCASSSDRDLVYRLNQAPPSDSAGLKAYCSQMQQLGNSSAGINSRLGALCTTNQSACSNTCASLEQKYRNLMASCENCDAYSVYASTAAQLSVKSNLCSRLSARGDALVAQGMSTTGNTGYGAYCAQVASASPNSNPINLQQPGSQTPSAQQQDSRFGQQNQYPTNDPYGCIASPNSPACIDCSKNPGSASCQQAAQARGEGGFKAAAASKAGKNSFNLNDNADGVVPEPYYGAKGSDRNVAIAQVPNNNGGGVGGGAGTQPASLGSARRAAAAPAPSGSPTEVEQGFRSGGYSPPASSGSGSGFEPESMQPRRRGAQGGSNETYVGVDLKQYLPGGSLDPGRRMAGVAKTPGINVKEEDIWRRISIKIYEKCKLGVLWRCD